MTDKEIDRIIKANIQMAGFISLVKRMREAQKERNSLSSKITFLTEEDTRIRANSIRKTMRLESEVDEYLKKMESIDQRKALEAKNTEFDYGHNVKHYSED